MNETDRDVERARREFARLGRERADFVRKDPNFRKSKFMQGMALAYEWYAHHIECRQVPGESSNGE